MAKKSDELMDRRIVQRRIRQGRMTRKEYDAHLKSLPDVADKVAPPAPEDEGADAASDGE